MIQRDRKNRTSICFVTSDLALSGPGFIKIYEAGYFPRRITATLPVRQIPLMTRDDAEFDEIHPTSILNGTLQGSVFLRFLQGLRPQVAEQDLESHIQVHRFCMGLFKKSYLCADSIPEPSG